MDALETKLIELLRKASELEGLLKPFEKDIADCCAKPLGEMGVSEKIKLAQLLVRAAKK